MAIIEENKIKGEPKMTPPPVADDDGSGEKPAVWDEMSPRVAFAFGLTAAIAAASGIALIVIFSFFVKLK